MFVDVDVLDKVSKSLDEHYNSLSNEERKNCIGFFALGSMNYNLFTKGSDVDTMAVVLPSNMSDIIWDRPKTIHRKVNDRNEYCVIKDVRDFGKELLKANPSVLQTLITPYYIEREEFDYFVDNADTIAHYNETQFVHTTTGQALSLINKLEKNYDEKQMYNALRLAFTCQRYLDNRSLEDCLYFDVLDDVEERDFLWKVKSGELTGFISEDNLYYDDIENLLNIKLLKEYLFHLRGITVGLEKEKVKKNLFDYIQEIIIENVL